MASDMIAKVIIYFFYILYFKFMQLNYFNQNKEKKQDVKLDKKKADDILENLFAEDE